MCVQFVLCGAQLVFVVIIIEQELLMQACIALKSKNYHTVYNVTG